MTGAQPLLAERTSRAIVVGTWACAVIVMVGSVTNAVLAYGAIGDNRALGLATGLAVDFGLCVALIGDRRLYAHGLSSVWGRSLRLTTACMALVLNTGVALRDGHYFMATLHAFLPCLLIVLTEYGQDVLLKFTALRVTESQTPATPQTLPVAAQSPPAPSTPAAPAVPRPMPQAAPSYPVVSRETPPPATSASPTRAPGLATSPRTSVPSATAPRAVPARPLTLPQQPRRAPARQPRGQEAAARRDRAWAIFDNEVLTGVEMRPDQVASRLGVTSRQVRRYREEWRTARAGAAQRRSA